METDALLPPASGPARGSQPRPGSVREGDKDATRRSPEAKFSWKQKKLLACLATVNVLQGSLIGVMIPFFPVEAAQRGVSQTVISAVFSTFALAQMALSPVVGRLVPVFGATWLYCIGLATAGASTVAFGTLNYIESTRAFVAACFLVRLVEAAGMAAVTTCAFTVAGSQFPGRVNAAVSVLCSALTVGLALTPPLWGGLYALGGFGASFFTLGLSMLLLAAVLGRTMPRIKPSAWGRLDFFGALRVFAGATGNWVCLAASFTFSADVNTVEATIAAYSNAAFGIPPSRIGLFFVVGTSLFAVMIFFWGWLTDRTRNPYVVMSLCLFASSAGILFMSPYPLLGIEATWWMLALGLIVAQLFFGGAYSPCLKTMLEATYARGLADGLATQSLVASMLQTSWSLGVAVGPVLGGVIVDAYGFPVMITVLAFQTAFVAALAAAKAIATHFDHARAKA